MTSRSASSNAGRYSPGRRMKLEVSSLSNVRRWFRLSMSRFSCASGAGGMGGGAGATAGGAEAWRLQLHGELTALLRSELLAQAC